MRTYKHTGTFMNEEGVRFELSVNCNNMREAFFLLIADAIREGKFYDLEYIEDEKGNVTRVHDIKEVDNILRKIS